MYKSIKIQIKPYKGQSGIELNNLCDIGANSIQLNTRLNNLTIGQIMD